MMNHVAGISNGGLASLRIAMLHTLGSLTGGEALFDFPEPARP